MSDTKQKEEALKIPDLANEATYPRRTLERAGYEALGRWIDDYKHTIAPVLGAGMMALSGVFLRSLAGWPWWIALTGFLSGFIFCIRGAVLSVRLAGRASELRDSLEKLKDPKRVFLVTHALSEEWQVVLEHKLLKELGDRGFRPTVFSAQKKYSHREQERHFREILERKDDYAGGLIIPVQPKMHRENLKLFCINLAKPIVFIDDTPFNSVEDYPPQVTFVGVSSFKGGELAAKALVSSSLSDEITKVLIIASDSQKDRQTAFEEYLKKVIPNCNIIRDDTAAFDRNIANELTRRYLLQAIHEGKPYDAVFCTSDPVALGCLDAISSINNWTQYKKPLVVGYDGIEATLKLVNDSSSPLNHVVIQDSHEIAVAAVEHLTRVLKGEYLAGPELIDPVLYPPLIADFGGSVDE